MSAPRFIDAQPYAWPYNGDLRPDNTALIVIDMQNDFCHRDGWLASNPQAPDRPKRVRQKCCSSRTLSENDFWKHSTTHSRLPTSKNYREAFWRAP